MGAGVTQLRSSRILVTGASSGIGEALAQITRGETPYEKSVREALAREKAAASGKGSSSKASSGAPSPATARRQP